MAITKLIDNFTGRLTRQSTGSMNSGLAKYATSFGYDPFSNLSNLTWLEAPIAINNPDGVGNGTLCMAAKPRLESGITYVYSVFDTGRVSKIQVNNPSAQNPNYDNPVLLVTLSSGSPAFSYGSSIQFFGTTERMYIGHDTGVTRIDLPGGANETYIGQADSTHWIVNVPRPSAQFLGKTYWGNGSNIAEIDTTNTVTNYFKLSPGFPSGTFVRDLDVSPDGNYLQITVSKINSPILNTTTQDTTSLSSADSYKFLWNGTDAGYTSYQSYSGYSLNSNTVFGSYNYTMGYDLGGAALYSSTQKILSLPNSLSPTFNTMFPTGNLLGFAAPEYVASSANLQGSIFFYGQYDNEVPKGLFRILRQAPVSGVDVAQLPVCLTVSNLFYGSAFNNYAGNVVGSAKIYFSIFEPGAQGSGNFYYKFYKFTTVPTGLGTAIGGVYETQQETSIKLFRTILKKRLKVYEIRVFCPPLVANNQFKIDIIGNDGNPIANASYTFTVGTNVTVGDTMVKYNPMMNGSYSIGIRVTNLGTKNWVCEKIEVDIDEIGA